MTWHKFFKDGRRNVDGPAHTNKSKTDQNICKTMIMWFSGLARPIFGMIESHNYLSAI